MTGRLVGGRTAGRGRGTERKDKKKTHRFGGLGRDERRSGGEEELTSEQDSSVRVDVRGYACRCALQAAKLRDALVVLEKWSLKDKLARREEGQGGTVGKGSPGGGAGG